MKNFLNKIFSSSKNLYSFKNNIKKLSLTTPVKKIFEAINSHSSESEIRYVGGCLRKILNNEKVDDIDLATNLNPLEVTEILKKIIKERGESENEIIEMLSKNSFCFFNIQQ